MRFLFYLPVVTPWWFDAIVAPLIRAAATGGEVHVLVPPLWRGTGIEGEQLLPLADLETVHWHILDGDDHPALRRIDRSHPAVLDLVTAIAPDFCLCRSADLETPARFPGVVRHIMEGGAPPFRTGSTWIYLPERLFENGQMPALSPAERTRIDNVFKPVWQAKQEQYRRCDRADFLDRSGLPHDRRILALPLEYEHPEMFYRQHDAYPGNVALIERLLETLDAETVLAVTNHPVAELHSDNSALLRTIRAHRGRVHLVSSARLGGDATNLLARFCDGLVVGNSKCFAAAAFFGVPTARLSRFGSADWTRCVESVDDLTAAIAAGTAHGAEAADARTWFAHHLLNTAFDAAAPDMDAAALARRMILPVDESRWGAALDRLLGRTLAEAA